MKTFEQDARVIMVDSIGEIPRHRRFFNTAQGVLCPYNPLTEAQRAELFGFARHHVALNGATTISSQRLLPSFLTPVIHELEHAFARATGSNRSAIMRINSTAPRTPHAHEASLTSTFSGVGTIALDQNGKEYAAPLDHIFIFHRAIRHRASQYRSAEMPKITLMV